VIDQTLRFTDGAGYEKMMGRWSLLVGDRFIDWIAVPPHARWLDVGCGNGAFTELIVSRCTPSEVQAFDPSEAQLAYARTRLTAAAPVTWAEADAMQLPVLDESFDCAVMALVLFFVPEPSAGLAEMCRAVRPGGVVCAYHWDILGGGFPLADIGAEMLKLGLQPLMPPSVGASTLEASAGLWQGAGLRAVRTCQFTVQRTFDSFEDYWSSAASSSTMRPMFDSMPAQTQAQLKDQVFIRMGSPTGPLTVSARANAVTGLKP
jgi:SAM-dependent methyltransferase